MAETPEDKSSRSHPDDQLSVGMAIWIYLGILAWVGLEWYLHPHPSAVWRNLFPILFFIPSAALAVIALGTLSSRRRIKRAARNILNQNRTTYSGEDHEYRLVSLDEFPSLDRDFYERMLTWFTTHGFIYLGDRQNLTLAAIFKRTTALRTLISEDGTIVGTAYHMHFPKTKVVQGIRLNTNKDVYIIELESELSDGTFLATSNSLESARVLPFPGADVVRLAAQTAPEQILEAQRGRLAAATAAGRNATVSRTMDEVIAFHRRAHRLKCRHKASVGFVGAADLQAVRGRPLNDREKKVAGEIERLKKSP